MRLALAVDGAMALGMVTLMPAAAAGAQVVGSYTSTNLGQGCHGGGPLYADGTFGGGGPSRSTTGRTSAKFVPASWAPAGPGLVTVCLTDTAIKGDVLFVSRLCVTVPVTGTPVVLSSTLPPGEHTLLRITLFS